MWRNAKAPNRQPPTPRWILVPNVPVAKQAKARLREPVPNDGIHLQGGAVMPPGSRLREPLDEQMGESGARYCPRGGPLTSITAKPVVAGDVAYVNTYN